VVEAGIEKSLAELAELIDGEVVGDSSIRICGACGIQNACRGEITFLTHPKYLPSLEKSQASSVIVGKDCSYTVKPVIRVEDPAKAFLKVMQLWQPDTQPLQKTGVHPSASVAASAKLGRHVFIDAGVVVGENCEIGDGSSILANTVLGEGCALGKNVLLYENVTVRDKTRIDSRVILHPGVVIGADGFGFETISGKHVKVPQRGNVWIQEDVEIGANSCVDRARFGTTVVKKGTKIDNLVQIAHNVSIGENCLIISQVGIAGSSEVGDNVILAGQAGVVDHVKIGRNSKIGAQGAVTHSVPENSVLLGSPARPIREVKERLVYQSRLPELFKDVKQIKKKITPQ